MRKVLITILILSGSVIFANQMVFLEKLQEKKIATFEDAVLSFCYLYELNISENFDDNINNLKTNIKTLPKKYSKDKKLTIGDFSLLACQYLKIKSGIFYLITKSGRYASRELMILDIIPANISELDEISGIELIRLIQKVDDYANKK